MPRLDANTLASRYGYSAAFFNSYPELKAMLITAVTQQWTPEEFAARFRNTNWYKGYSDKQREWAVLEKTDPATANARRQQATALITQRASQMGVPVDPTRLKDIVQRYLSSGWDADELDHALTAEMKYDPTLGTQGLKGDTAADAAAIREMLNAYGVSISDKAVWNLVIAQNNDTMDDKGIQEYIRKMALSKYPGLADQINAGMSVADVASSYTQSKARLLEVPPDTITVDDPSVQRALQARDKDGKAVPMTLFDFELGVRKDPRWYKTENARDSLLGGAQQVLSDMGLV